MPLIAEVNYVKSLRVINKTIKHLNNIIMAGLVLYCIISYLFEIGCLDVPFGTNWYNFLFAPIFMPIKIGRGLANLMNK